MKKKLILIFAVIALVAVLTTCFVACNKGYKWHSVGGGDATAAVESNGGYVVKQGNYLYMINGFAGSDEDNTFGKPVKQSIVRVELNADGTPNNDTAVVVVPKSIYNSSTKNGGFAIFGDWIYYVTNNYDKDKNGNESTTDSDFMRTKIDGSATQLIATIGSRSVEYLFTESRVWYFSSNVLYYVDFSGMKNKGDITNGKGAVKGQLSDTISSVVLNYDASKIYFTRSASSDSSMTYNELCSIDKNGANLKVLATLDTYLARGEKAIENQQKVFTFSLLGVKAEADGADTLYYTKSYKLNETKNAGLFMNKVAGEFKVADEKHLTTNSVTTLYPLGYSEGALAYDAQSVYCWYSGDNAGDPLQVTDGSKTVWFVRDGYAYYTAASSPTTLYKIAYKVAENTSIILEEGMKADWLPLDGAGDNFYFFASNDNNYIHYINYLTFDKDAEDAKSTMVGIYLDSEKPEEE